MNHLWLLIDRFDGVFHTIAILIWWCVVWPAFIVENAIMLYDEGLESVKIELLHTLRRWDN